MRSNENIPSWILGAALALLALMIFGIATLNQGCKARRGVLVKAAFGYVCIEEGRHAR